MRENGGEGLKGQVLEDFEHLVMKVFIGNL